MKKIMLIGIAVVAIGVGLVLLVAKRMEHGAGGMEQEIARSKISDANVEADPGGSPASASLDSKIATPLSGSYAEDKLSDAVKALLGLDGKVQNYDSLIDAIGKLSKDLSDEDVAALRDMLTWPNSRFQQGMLPIEINAIKNDVLDRLLRLEKLPVGIGFQLVEMASYPETDLVWRDYCVQYMQPFYERVAAENREQGAGSEVASDQSASSAGQLDAVREAMFSALDERGSTIAGTSLIGLELLSRTHDEFDREVIVNSALDIASDESASTASRMTALRLAAGIGTTDNTEYTESTADTARLIAQTGETVLLRSAAIVTLGEMGTDTDRELLQSYTQDENQQIASAAKLALQKMDAPMEPVVDLSQPNVSDDTATTQSEPKLPPVLIN